jgi:hypothetical protein
MKENIYLWSVDIKRCQFCDSEINLYSSSVVSDKDCVKELMIMLKKHFSYCKGDYKIGSTIQFNMNINKKTQFGDINRFSNDKDITL